MHSLAESRKKKLRTDNVRHIFTGLSGGLDPEVPPADISSATPPRTFTGGGGLLMEEEEKKRREGEERRWREGGIRGRG